MPLALEIDPYTITHKPANIRQQSGPGDAACGLRVYCVTTEKSHDGRRHRSWAEARQLDVNIVSQTGRPSRRPPREHEVDSLGRRHNVHSRGLGLVEVLADILKSILEWEAGHDGEAELTDPAEHVDCFEPRLIVLRGGKDDDTDA